MTVKFQLQNVINLWSDVLGLGLGLAVVASLLNSLVLLKEAMAVWRAARTSSRWGDREV